MPVLAHATFQNNFTNRDISQIFTECWLIRIFLEPKVVLGKCCESKYNEILLVHGIQDRYVFVCRREVRGASVESTIYLRRQQQQQQQQHNLTCLFVTEVIRLLFSGLQTSRLFKSALSTTVPNSQAGLIILTVQIEGWSIFIGQYQMSHVFV